MVSYKFYSHKGTMKQLGLFFHRTKSSIFSFYSANVVERNAFLYLKNIELIPKCQHKVQIPFSFVFSMFRDQFQIVRKTEIQVFSFQLTTRFSKLILTH